MPKNVDVPGLGLVEFPDDMTDDAISGAIKEHTSSAKPQDFSALANVPASGDERAARDYMTRQSFDQFASRLAPGPDVLTSAPTGLMDRFRNTRIGKAIVGDPGAVAGNRLQREGLGVAAQIPAAVATKGGEFAKAALSDIAAPVIGKTPEADFGGNVKELFKGGGKTQLPFEHALELARQEEQEKGEFGVASLSADISLGLADLAPKIAMIEAAPGGMIPQSVTSAGVFGFDKEGKFQPKQAAFAAAFPFVTKAASVATDAALSKAVQNGAKWAENPGAQKAIHIAANQAAMNTVMAVQSAPELMKLSRDNPDEFKREVIKMIGSNLAFAIPEAIKTHSPTTKGAPDAIQPKGPPVLRDVQTQPVEGAGKVPTETRGSEAGVRGGEDAEREKRKVSLIEQVSKATPEQLLAIGKTTGGITKNAYRLGETASTEDIPKLEQARDAVADERKQLTAKADAATTMDEKMALLNQGMAAAMKRQWFDEAIRWRKALDKAKSTGAKTIKDFAAIEKELGVGSPTTERAGHELMATVQRQARQKVSPGGLNSTPTESGGGRQASEPAVVPLEVESTTPLDPQSGSPLTEEEVAARSPRRSTDQPSELHNAIMDAIQEGGMIQGIKKGGDKSGHYVAWPHEEGGGWTAVGPFEDADAAKTFLDSEVGAQGARVVETGPKGELIGPGESVSVSREEPKTTTEPAIASNEKGDITKASVPERAVQALEEYAKLAQERLAQKRTQTYYGAGPLHELPNIRDFAIIGAAKIARGTLDFAKWSAEMIREHGEQIRPYINQIWDHARQIINETVTSKEPAKTEAQRIIEQGVGMGGHKAAEDLGLNIPETKVEELTGVKKPEPKKVTVSEKAALKEVLSKSEQAGEAGRKAGFKEAQAEAKGMMTELRQRLSDSVRKVDALTHYFRGQEKAGAAGRAAATKALELADRWLEADARNIGDALIKLVNKSLPPEERGRFNQAIANAMRRHEITTTEVTVGAKRQKVGNKFITIDPGEKVTVAEAMYRRAAEVAARIEARADEVYKSNTIDEIKETVARATKSPSVDVEYRKRIEDEVKVMSFSKLSAVREAKLKGTKEYAERTGAQSLPDEVVSELDLLNKVPASDLPIQVLEAIRDRVNLLEQLGRLKVKGRQHAWDAEKEQLGKTMSESESTKLESHPELRPQPGEKSTFSLRMRNFINRRLNSVGTIDRGISPRDVMMDLMDGAKATYRGFMSRTFSGRIDSAFNRMIVRRDAISDPVMKYGRDQKFNDQNYERIGAYAIMQQEGGRERLVANGADPKILDKINSTMTPAELKMYKMMRDSMDKLLPEVQSLMRNLYNIDVKPVKDYFPLQRDWRQFEPTPEAVKLRKERGGEVEYDELATWKTLEQDYIPRQTTKAERGFTVERVPDAETPIKIHALDVFNRHIQDVSHLLETQRDLKMLGEITRDKPFLNQYGNMGQKFTIDWLDTVARQGGTEAFRRLAILDTLRRNTTLGVIGFRLSSQFVHLANIPLAMNQSGPGWYFKGAKEALTPEGQAFVRKHFAETFARAGAEPAIEEAGKAKLGPIPIGKLAEPAFWIVRNIDKLNAQATALANYQKILAEKGVNPEFYDKMPIDEAARNEALIRTRRAVASPLPKDVPQALSRGSITGGNVSVGRALFQFQNVFLDQWSAIRHDLVRAGIQNKNPKYAAQTMAALAAMVLIETGIKMGVQGITHEITGYQPKHPTSFDEKLVHESLRRFPFMGNLLGITMYGETGIPAIDAVVQLGKGTAKTFTSKTERTQEKAAIQTISGALQMSGVPGASQIGEIIEKSQ